MSRIIKIGAAQSGPIMKTKKRKEIIERLIFLLRRGYEQGCEMIVFTECALTPFFPHWWIDNMEEFQSYFEKCMPNKHVQPLFDEAKRLGLAFHLGYAEIENINGQIEYYNSSIVVDQSGNIIGKYRKIHLPGHSDFRPNNPFQNLEKRYFRRGNLGFCTVSLLNTKFGICICNDRRWPETFRSLALMGAEIILLGYNTPLHCKQTTSRDFHRAL